MFSGKTLTSGMMHVAQTLRDAKHMMTEGAVGDTLKSAPFFFLCAALHTREDCSEEEKLFREIAQSSASDFGIAIELSALSRSNAIGRC